MSQEQLRPRQKAPEDLRVRPQMHTLGPDTGAWGQHSGEQGPPKQLRQREEVSGVITACRPQGPPPDGLGAHLTAPPTPFSHLSQMVVRWWKPSLHLPRLSKRHGEVAKPGLAQRK